LLAGPRFAAVAELNGLPFIEDVASGNIFSQGQIGVAGIGFTELNAPYDSKVVGDYTGLTEP